jgi:hypothetical protein
VHIGQSCYIGVLSGSDMSLQGRNRHVGGGRVFAADSMPWSDSKQVVQYPIIMHNITVTDESVAGRTEPVDFPGSTIDFDEPYIDVVAAEHIGTQASKLKGRIGTNDDDSLTQAASGSFTQQSFNECHAPQVPAGSGTSGVDPHQRHRC